MEWGEVCEGSKRCLLPFGFPLARSVLDRLHPMAAAAARESRSELSVSEALLDGLRRLDESAFMHLSTAKMDEVFLRNDEQIAKIGGNW